ADIRARVARHRNTLLFGSAAPEPPADQKPDRHDWLPAIFDVRSLCFLPSDVDLTPFPGLPSALTNPAPPSFNNSGPNTNVGLDFDSLRDLCDRFAGDEGSIDVTGGDLIVRKPPAALERVRATLDSLRPLAPA